MNMLSVSYLELGVLYGYPESLSQPITDVSLLMDVKIVENLTQK